GPGVGPVGNEHAKFERSEAGLSCCVLLQEILNFLIDGNSAGPTGGSLTAPLHVPGKQFDPRKQTADAPHVAIAIASNAIAHTVQDERAILKRFERRKAFLEFEIGPF